MLFFFQRKLSDIHKPIWPRLIHTWVILQLINGENCFGIYSFYSQDTDSESYLRGRDAEPF